MFYNLFYICNYFTKVGETGGNCNTLNSSNQNQARVMKLNLQMLSKIICMWKRSTVILFFNKILILWYEFFWGDVQYFSAAV